MPELSWAELTPVSATVEIRFGEDAFLLWDRAGMLWSEVRRTHRSLEVGGASPSQTVFRLDKRWELVCELKSARVLDHQAGKPEEIVAVAQPLFDAVRDVLDVQSYSRIGYRVVFRKEFDSVQTASAYFLESPILSFPERRLFGSEGAVTLPEAAAQWNGKAHAVMLRMKVEERRAELTLPFAPDLEKLVTIRADSATMWSLLVDVDYFTKGVVRAEQWNLEEWIKQSAHVIRRDGLEWINTRRPQ